MTSPARRARRSPLSGWASRGCAAVAVVVAVLGISSCAAAPDPAPRPAPPSVAVSPTPTLPTAPALRPAAAAPERVVIPAIHLDESLIELGLNADATMQVPSDFDEVGWFTGGGRPGGHGPVVIAGHVDSPTGPAVFVRLEELRSGDAIDVIDETGMRHAYVVTEVADYPKSDFPTAQVFGAVAADDLRLITCGGVFDPAAASYVDNRVVYATRAPP